jgi:4-carboxymuconolactone decarboxylase
MTPADAARATLVAFDDGTRALVRLSAMLAGGTEDALRPLLADAHRTTPPEWIEELLLQTYLFAGFPRALNGMREWRRLSGRPAPDQDPAPPPTPLRQRGEATCATVYGSMYDRLRVNIRALHPALDDWMIEEGYGKVLSRPGLDLPRRELCIVAACAATGQDRQLQSHLHGARNAGVAEPVVGEALRALRAVIPDALLERSIRMWERVRHDVH